jgi:hypothetical protein
LVTLINEKNHAGLKPAGPRVALMQRAFTVLHQR